MSQKKPNKLIVADVGWAQDAPEWLLEEVTRERLILGLAGIRNPTETETVGDAEACLFLFTRALAAPMNSEMSEAYIYLAAKLTKERNPNAQLEDFMEEKLKRGLTDWEKHELGDLKRTLYSKRGGKIRHPVLDAVRSLKRRNQGQRRTLGDGDV